MWISNVGWLVYVGLADTVSLSPERLSMNDCSDVELRAAKRAHSYLYLHLSSLLLSMKLDFLLEVLKIYQEFPNESFPKDRNKKTNVLVDDLTGNIGGDKLT